MAPVCIRQFEFDRDYDSAVALWESMEKGIRVGRSDSPVEIKRKLERDPDLFLVAEDEGRLVGTVIGGFDGRRGYIYHLAVESGHRRQGVGGMLMDEVERRLRAKGCLKCYLVVTPDNVEAMRYYEKRGWQRSDNPSYAKEFN